MSSKFQDFSPATPITAAWLNQVDDLVEGLPSGTGGTQVAFLQALAGAVLLTMQAKAGQTVDIRDFGVVADGATDSTTLIGTVLTALASAGFRGFIRVPYNTKFTIHTVYAAVPVGIVLIDYSSINTGQPPGYKNKFVTVYSGDNVNDDSQNIVASGHHAARTLLNMGTAGTSSAASYYASDLYSVGQNADKDFITALQHLRSKAPGKTSWRDSTVLLSDYTAALSPKWVTATAATNAVTYCYYGANYYVAASTGTTGPTPPTHTVGTVSDGGINWTWAGYYGGGYTLRWMDTDGENGWAAPLTPLVLRYQANTVAGTREIRETFDLNGDWTIRAASYGADLIKFVYSLGQLDFTVNTMFGSGTADTPLAVNQLTFVSGYGGTLSASTDTARKFSFGITTGSMHVLSYDRTDLAVRWGVSATGHLTPGGDNLYTLSTAAARSSVVYSATAAINTSDERYKTLVQDIDPAVLRAWGRVQYCQYKFTDAVAKKANGARWHMGVIAQRVKEAFEAEGLDAFAYGLLCYDSWEELAEVRSKGGDVMQHAQAAGDRYALRYEEALALECALMRSKMAAIEARLAALP